jgi:8-oxo-dGTP pyrophosphatase MutT (NUDIX family)
MPAGEPDAGAMIEVVAIERLDLRFDPRPWRFAIDRRAEIDRHFGELRRHRPALWDGRVLLLHQHRIQDGVFRGSYLETEFSSFISWRDWDFPDAGVRNCFAAGAVLGSDGGFLLGVMGDHTASSGRIYFPAGTPDPDDVVGSSVDLAGSMLRELAEETGLTTADVVAEAGWYGVMAGPRIAIIKILRAPQPAEVLRRRIMGYIAAQAESELSEIRIVRGPADLEPTMPSFVGAFLNHVWKAPAP